MVHKILVTRRGEKAPVRVVRVYSIKKRLTLEQVERGAAMLANPVVEQYFIDTWDKETAFEWAVEIGYLPGVTDNVASTVKEIWVDGLGIFFGKTDQVYTSSIYWLTTKMSRRELQRFVEDRYNPIIQKVVVARRSQFEDTILNPKNIPEVELSLKQAVTTVNLNIRDEELVLLGKTGIANSDGSRRGPLALNLSYMKAIQTYFRRLKREPTDVELESLAQTWSEHCKHTIFSDPIDEDGAGLFKTYIQKATEEIRIKQGARDFCASVFTDNSGAIEFDRGYLITHKVETHNSPSALDPFGGAITGIVGVNRDTIGFGLGAKPIANTYGFCVADPRDTTLIYRDRDKQQPMLTPRRILDGVVAGVNAGGNCSGISTPQGFVLVDGGYKGKPLVFVGTVGLVPKRVGKRSMTHKQARPGDLIVMVGGRVGLDGIHGATFSSEALTGGSPATAVQIGDPITQKKMSDVLIKEGRDLGLYSSITDNGAGGLSCSVAEMAKEAGGCEVELERVPVKYPGLAPWQIWISESQERMTLAVPPKKWSELERLLMGRGVEATVIGRFTDSGNCEVTFKGKNVMQVSMAFLHEGLPQQQLQAMYHKKIFKEPKRKHGARLTHELETMVGRFNLAGYSFISQQYDHEVQGSSVIKPLQGQGRVNGEATVIRPLPESNKGIVLSQGVYPTYGEIDAYQMAAAAIDTAVRNVIVTGANPRQIALLDNFCWCSSNDPERLGQLRAAARACYDTAVGLETPFISGKDSMFNDFKGFDERGEAIQISILPTLLISAIGIITDIRKAVSMDFKIPGDLIYLVGKTWPELGASEYYGYLGEVAGTHTPGNQVPRVQLTENRRVYQAVARCIQMGMVASAISVGRGGIGVALAKAAIGGRLGMESNLDTLPGGSEHNDEILFSESQGRVILSVDPKDSRSLEERLRNVPWKKVGVVTQNPDVLMRGMGGETMVRSTVERLSRAYKATFKGY
jgi:phosphoribosylformylglycinamidine synthase